MNIKEIDSKILFKEFEVQVPYKEVDNSINAKIVEIIPTVSLPGFRKGKAPLNIVKKKYENNVLSEVIEKLVEDKTKKLLEEKKLKPFRQPRVEIKKYEKNEPIEISIKIDLDPSIKIFPFQPTFIFHRFLGPSSNGNPSIIEIKVGGTPQKTPKSQNFSKEKDYLQ